MHSLSNEVFEKRKLVANEKNKIVVLRLKIAQKAPEENTVIKHIRYDFRHSGSTFTR